MAALKKTSLVFLIAFAVMLSAGVANAQTGFSPRALGQVTCQATAVPPIVRAEGIAELVGDVVLTCTNVEFSTSEFTQYIQTNMSVSLTVNVTNNIDFGAGTDVVDAVMVINENNTTSPTSVSTFGGPDPRFTVPHYGTLIGNNRIEWNRVNFPVPGAPNVPGAAPMECTSFSAIDPTGCFPSVTTLRFTSMRGNAAQLGVPDAATFPTTQIQAFVSITGPSTIPVNNNVLNVAVPIIGLLVDIDGPVTGLQCVSDKVTVDINLEEGFATAFKTIGVPTFQPGTTQWESGYYAPGSNNGGGASQGTRFMIRFFNVPDGVDVSVPNSINNGSSLFDRDALWIARVPGAATDGDGGSIPDGSDTGTYDVDISGGFGFVVYEVIDDNPFVTEDIDVAVCYEWEADTSNDSPAIGSSQASATFAPISTVFTASDSEPEPRFVDTGDNNLATTLSIERCTTVILFPFVTNQSGFDTGLVISNTSEDWLGTGRQSGPCTIHHHGETTGGGAAPADDTSSVLAAGDQLIWTLSNGNPAQELDDAAGFQGYIIAVCEFQFAHGYAFITDGFGGIPALAQGYLALIIPYDPGVGRIPGVWHYDADSNSFTYDGFGERLDQ